MTDPTVMQLRADAHKPPRRFAPERRTAPGSVLEAGYQRARTGRDARDRFAAYALDTVTAFIPASIALLYGVDEHGAMSPKLALRERGAAIPPTDPLAHRLGQLEPIDPYSVRRAQARGSRVLWAGDFGGDNELRRSMYGRHLARLDLRPPLHAYLWRDDAIAAGLMLLRSAREPAFDRGNARLLGEFEPLLEDALIHGCSAAARAPMLPHDVLTAREREVARLVLDGVSNACIGASLGMGEATVKTHLTRIYSKLGLRSRTELATRYRAD